MPISRSQMPRQMYGLGSFVKSIGKAAKKIVKSPIGKAALLYGGLKLAPMALGKIGQSGGFSNLIGSFASQLGPQATSGSGLLGLLGKAKTAFSGMGLGSKANLGILGASALSGLFAGKSQEEIQEIQNNPTALRGYLENYFTKLNPDKNPAQINELVEANMIENRSEGGRIGFQQGGSIMPRLNELGSSVSSAEQMLQEINQRLQSAESTLGEGGGGGVGSLPNNQFNVDPMSGPLQPALPSGFKQLPNGGMLGPTVPYNNANFQPRQMPIGQPPLTPAPSYSGGRLVPDLRTAGLEQLPNNVAQGMEGFAPQPGGGMQSPLQQAVGLADGGRIGYADGTEEIVQPSASMMVDTTTYNPIPEDADRQGAAEIAKVMMATRDLPREEGEIEDTETMSTKQFMTEQYLMPKVKQLVENFGISEIEALKMVRDEMMKLSKPGKAMGGRIKRAYGSDELVEQASGIEGLDVNINPKGVKELDLRDSGGFIPPVGVKEKADDIPAMLSNNEFVFTADAVRGMGDGNVNKGAQRMYDMMKKLENGGRV